MTSTPPAPAEQPTRERSAARAIVAAMRPRQWAKNVLVFAAPLAAGKLLSPDVFLVSVGAFVAFCLISSATYLVNDVRDVESDRAHPVKCSRPIAAGEVSTTTALIVAAVLAVLALALAFTISPALGGVLVAYAVFTGAYSLFLKNEPVIELVLLAMGFLLRAIAGGVASGLPISEWFLIVAASARYSWRPVSGTGSLIDSFATVGTPNNQERCGRHCVATRSVTCDSCGEWPRRSPSRRTACGRSTSPRRRRVSRGRRGVFCPSCWPFFGTQSRWIVERPRRRKQLLWATACW